jgi:protein AroM
MRETPMPRALLGTITIGQAPRPDITPILAQHLPGNVQCLHAGLLDGLTRAEIDRRHAPLAGQPTLITRLLDGSSVVVDKAQMLDLLLQKIAALEARGCDFILVLCTGAFDKLTVDRAWLIEPDHIVSPAVAALAGDRQIGVIVPLPSQMASEKHKWRALRHAPLCAAASPYADEVESLKRAAAELARQGARLLVLDCMGFVESHRAAAAEASGLPVILSNAIIARLTAELLSSSGAQR